MEQSQLKRNIAEDTKVSRTRSISYESRVDVAVPSRGHKTGRNENESVMSLGMGSIGFMGSKKHIHRKAEAREVFSV